MRVPVGEAFWMLARRSSQRDWEAVVPAFSIASQADSAEAAVTSAMELLDDYLALCQRDGKKFTDCYRPMDAAAGSAAGEVRTPTPAWAPAFRAGASTSSATAAGKEDTDGQGAS